MFDGSLPPVLLLLLLHSEPTNKGEPCPSVACELSHMGPAMFALQVLLLEHLNCRNCCCCCCCCCCSDPTNKGEPCPTVACELSHMGPATFVRATTMGDTDGSEAINMPLTSFAGSRYVTLLQSV
jgi:hypothetical protein